jgi:hypothetical protein
MILSSTSVPLMETKPESTMFLRRSE